MTQSSLILHASFSQWHTVPVTQHVLANFTKLDQWKEAGLCPYLVSSSQQMSYYPPKIQVILLLL